VELDCRAALAMTAGGGTGLPRCARNDGWGWGWIAALRSHDGWGVELDCRAALAMMAGGG